MNMFVLLEHEPGPEQQAAGERRHWDFLVEVAGQERLATWRLAASPLDAGSRRREIPISHPREDAGRDSRGTGCEKGFSHQQHISHQQPHQHISAERIADHRRVYLTYEGEISGGRGQVRRIDAGAAQVVRFDGDEIEVAVKGEHLRGVVTIERVADGGLAFRYVAGPGA